MSNTLFPLDDYIVSHKQEIDSDIESEGSTRTYKRQHGLDPFEMEILNLLERTVVLTPTELEYLAHIEQQHTITHDE